MTGEPEVSVVMSVHNGAQYLRGAVDSILNQQGVSFEVLVVNDGSTDESARVLDEYATLDPRVRVIHQKNTGLTQALIRGCSEARGEFIARQDADDISLPDRLRLQVDLLKQTRAAFVSSWVLVAGPALEPLGEIAFSMNDSLLSNRLKNDFYGVPCHGSVMFRRESYKAAGGYRSEFYFAQDSDLWYRMVETGGYGCVRQHLYLLRQSVNSISGSRRDVQAAFHRLGLEAARLRRAGGDDSSAVAQARDLCVIARERSPSVTRTSNMAVSSYMIGSTLIRRGDVRGRRYLLTAIRLRPFYLKAWAMVAASFLFRLSVPNAPAALVERGS